jgi:hypothetical protein
VAADDVPLQTKYLNMAQLKAASDATVTGIARAIEGQPIMCIAAAIYTLLKRSTDLRDALGTLFLQDALEENAPPPVADKDLS